MQNICWHLFAPPPSTSDFLGRFKLCLWPGYFLLQSKDFMLLVCRSISIGDPNKNGNGELKNCDNCSSKMQM